MWVCNLHHNRICWADWVVRVFCWRLFVKYALLVSHNSLASELVACNCCNMHSPFCCKVPAFHESIRWIALKKLSCVSIFAFSLLFYSYLRCSCWSYRISHLCPAYRHYLSCLPSLLSHLLRVSLFAMTAYKVGELNLDCRDYINWVLVGRRQEWKNNLNVCECVCVRISQFACILQ